MSLTLSGSYVGWLGASVEVSYLLLVHVLLTRASYRQMLFSTQKNTRTIVGRMSNK